MNRSTDSARAREGTGPLPEEDAPLLVVGAGIGGLGTAVALGRRRIPYVLVEALPRPRAIDAGILLQHNTVHVLDALGVGEGLAAAARRVTGTSIRSVSIRSVSIRSARAGSSRRSTPPTWKGRPALRPWASTAGNCARPCRHGSPPPPSSRATPPAASGRTPAAPNSASAPAAA